MSRDKFWFKSDGSSIGVDASFGCQTYESGMFNTQVADGITGWSMGRSYGPTLFDWFLQGTKAPDVFSMCLSETIGAMVLGGAVPAALPAGGQWIPYTGGSSYTVELVDIKLDGKSTGASSSNYRSTIVDSGTTFMYLPPTVRAHAPATAASTATTASTFHHPHRLLRLPQAYRAMRDFFRSHCPWGSCSSRVAKGEYPDDYCFTMSTAELDQLPPYSLHFGNGVTLPFGPRQYAYELRKGVWCLGVFDNEHNGAVIGASNMRNHEVIFDPSTTSGWVPSDCAKLTTAPPPPPSAAATRSAAAEPPEGAAATAAAAAPAAAAAETVAAAAAARAVAAAAREAAAAEPPPPPHPSPPAKSRRHRRRRRRRPPPPPPAPPPSPPPAPGTHLKFERFTSQVDKEGGTLWTIEDSDKH